MTETMTDHEKIKKAAILISTLDRRSADQLLEQMPAAEADRVRRRVMTLGDVDPSEQEAVVREFLGARSQQSIDENSGVELDLSLADRIVHPTEDNLQQIGRQANKDTPRFRAVYEVAPDVLCDHLQGEHPQTVAVLLSHLAPKRAADILTQLPPRMQTDVVGRLIDLDEADPAVVEEIERQLDEMLSDRMARERRRAAGVAAVSSILAAADQQSRRQLIASLTQHDQQLAGRLGRSTLSAADSHSVARPIDALPTQAAEPFRPPAKSRVLAAESPDSPARKSVRGRSRSVELSELERSPEMSQTDAPSRAEPNMDRETAPTGPAPDFHSLTGLSNPALARVLMSVDPHLAILALAGASRELVERVMRQLPTRDARSLRRRIEEIGPVRLGDVEEAQRRVAEEAQRAGFLSSAPVDSAPSLSAIV